MKIHIKVTWIDSEGKITCQEFDSLYRCAIYFGVGPGTMKKIIEGQTIKKTIPLLKNATFEVKGFQHRN